MIPSDIELIRQALKPGNELDLSTLKARDPVPVMEEVIHKDRVGFPYISVVYPDMNLNQLFNNVKKFHPEIFTTPFRIVNVNASRGFFRRYPVTFRGSYAWIPANIAWYETINILTDFYSEEARMKSKGYGAKMSPYDQWFNPEERRKFLSFVAQGRTLSLRTLRDAIYTLGKEARGSKITNSLSLYHYFSAERILDPSAAWGDRLIAAMGSAHVKRYVGVDPNTDLAPAWAQILTLPHTADITMINAPFEDVDLGDELFDFVIISPPPFIGDVYGNPEGQSVTSHPEFDDWFDNFMVPYVCKAAQHLSDGGYLAITILDRKGYRVTEPLLDAVQDNCPGVDYEGVVGWQTDSQKMVPWWMFRKRILMHPELKHPPDESGYDDLIVHFNGLSEERALREWTTTKAKTKQDILDWLYDQKLVEWRQQQN